MARIKTGGGSRKGIPNKFNGLTREALKEYIESKGPKADPGKVLVNLMMTAKDPKLVAQCALGLLDRLVPKLRQDEIELGKKTRHAIEHRYGQRQRSTD